MVSVVHLIQNEMLQVAQLGEPSDHLMGGLELLFAFKDANPQLGYIGKPNAKPLQSAGVLMLERSKVQCGDASGTFGFDVFKRGPVGEQAFDVAISNQEANLTQ